jgi:SAM-dependent methyltransferase
MSAPQPRSSQAYWDLTAETYDQIFPETLIGCAQRDAVWRELGSLFRPGQRILELNCGTGIDAVYLAKNGVRILACDISPRMIEVSNQRARAAEVSALTDFRVLPTEEIAVLAKEGPFDGAFSNFSGLNCVEDHSNVARNLAQLLKPGAHVLLCIVGRFVPWEIVWHLAHGNLAKATHRFRRSALTRFGDDVAVKVQYPSVRMMARTFAPEFNLRRWTGVGVAVPPSPLEPVARTFPGVLEVLAKLDRHIAHLPLFRNLADCVLLHFERTWT